jgi:hypothetical protein
MNFTVWVENLFGEGYWNPGKTGGMGLMTSDPKHAWRMSRAEAIEKARWLRKPGQRATVKKLRARVTP